MKRLYHAGGKTYKNQDWGVCSGCVMRYVSSFMAYSTAIEHRLVKAASTNIPKTKQLI